MTCPVCNCPPAQCIACTPMTRAAAMVRNYALAKAGAAFKYERDRLERRHGYGPEFRDAIRVHERTYDSVVDLALAAFALACRADRG